MIENRSRIEKQIYLGRQYVRRSLKSAGRLPEASSSQAKHGLRVASTPPPTGSDYPLSLDTDAEQAIVNGSSRIFKHNRSYLRNNIGLRGQIHRRSYYDEPLNPTSSSSQRAEPMTTSQNPLQVDQPSFLTRLRTKSFPNGSLLNAGKEQYATKSVEHDVGERLWSSDSSSDYDLSADEI
jgi:hypothetical protein